MLVLFVVDHSQIVEATAELLFVVIPFKQLCNLMVVHQCLIVVAFEQGLASNFDCSCQVAKLFVEYVHLLVDWRVAAHDVVVSLLLQNVDPVFVEQGVAYILVV